MAHRTLVLAALWALPLAACAGDANLVRDAALASGVTGGEPRPAPDFVTRTRTAGTEYLPIGGAPRRPTRAKNADAVADAEAEMNGLRARNETRAAAARREGATPAPKPVAPPRE